MKSKIITWAVLGASALVRAESLPASSPRLLKSQQGALPNIVDQLKQELELRVTLQKLPRPAHFLVIFGYDGPKQAAADSHTFASWVRVNEGSQKWSDISWLPDEFDDEDSENYKKICVFKNLVQALGQVIGGDPCDPVRAENYKVNKTFELAANANKTMGVWGPYLVTPELYTAGVKHALRLNERKFEYIAKDTTDRPAGRAMNCMHAVSDFAGPLLPLGGALNSGVGIWGIRGTQHVVRFYRELNHKYLYHPLETRRVIDPVDEYDYRSFSGF